ncbi:MDR family MFS transporter [Pendulispora albinea]|uniref:MFS transporter n=1 Tax=Pendulispora albinea TaxID=2741071 RepID=A0ABZ2M5W1_9BACT
MIESRPSLVRNLRGLPGVLWFLLVGAFINRFGTFLLPFLVLYLTSRGFSEAQAGLALSAYGIGNFAASFIGGHLSDHIGRRNTIVISMLASAVVVLALSQAQSLALLIVLTLCAGAAADTFRPAAEALVVDLCTPEQQLTAAALYRFAAHLGFALGPIAAGLLVNRSYNLLFAADAASSVLFGLIALAFLPWGARHPAPEGKQGRWLTTALSDWRFVRFLVASLAITTVTVQMDATLGLHILRVGHSASTYGMLMSVNGALIVLFEVSMTVVTQRFPQRTVMAVGYVMTAAGFALTAVAMSKLAIGLTIALWTFGEMAFSPVANVHVAQLAPPHLRGRYMGLFNASLAISLILGPVIGTMTFAYSESLVWSGCGILGVAAAVLILI